MCGQGRCPGAGSRCMPVSGPVLRSLWMLCRPASRGLLCLLPGGLQSGICSHSRARPGTRMALAREALHDQTHAQCVHTTRSSSTHSLNFLIIDSRPEQSSSRTHDESSILAEAPPVPNSIHDRLRAGQLDLLMQDVGLRH